MRREFDLNAEERLTAEELINELQARIGQLQGRSDEHLKVERKFFNYSPVIYKLTFGDNRTVIHKGAGEIKVSFNGKDVVKITGTYLDGIDFDGLVMAMIHIRQYMVLDDLASL